VADEASAEDDRVFRHVGCLIRALVENLTPGSFPAWAGTEASANCLDHWYHIPAGGQRLPFQNMIP
jgi:hypothetical protein